MIALINYRVTWLILHIRLFGKHEYSIVLTILWFSLSLCILMMFEGYCAGSLWITLWGGGRCKTKANLLKKLPTCLLTAWDYARHAPTGVFSTWSNEEDGERPFVWTSPRDCDGMKLSRYALLSILCAIRDLLMERGWRESQTQQFKGGLWYRWSYHTGV